MANLTNGIQVSYLGAVVQINIYPPGMFASYNTHIYLYTHILHNVSFVVADKASFYNKLKDVGS